MRHPKQGHNAFYELAHQIMQTRDLSNPDAGLKMNWTVATGGNTRNVIPAEPHATTDEQVLRVEHEVRRRVLNPPIPGTEIELVLKRRRSPPVATKVSRARDTVDSRRPVLWYRRFRLLQS